MLLPAALADSQNLSILIVHNHRRRGVFNFSVDLDVLVSGHADRVLHAIVSVAVSERQPSCDFRHRRLNSNLANTKVCFPIDALDVARCARECGGIANGARGEVRTT
jgi:hypothetical protein